MGGKRERERKERDVHNVSVCINCREKARECVVIIVVIVVDVFCF